MIPQILAAARGLRPYLEPTPTLPSPLLSREFGLDLWLKFESDSPVGSFKARGAFRCLMERSRQGHSVFVTASSGNHGTAVAFAGRRLGRETHVYVPKSASARKIQLIAAYTPNLVLTDTDFDGAKEIARGFAEREGHYFIDDGADETIVEGTGTIATELLDAVTPEIALVPVGNGALVSGIGEVLKAFSPATRLIGIQPESAPTMYLSWKERRPVQLPAVRSMADGLVSRVAVREAVASMNRLVDDMWLVTEDEIRNALRLFVRAESRIAEPSSVVGIACLGRPELQGRIVATIITGRNIDLDSLKALL